MDKKIYCSNCGALTNSGANYCQGCGAALHGPESAIYHANAPAVAPGETPTKTPTTNPKVEYYPRQNLGGDALLYFIISYLGKTILLLGLFVVGTFLMPKVYALVLAIYFVCVVVAAYLEYNNFTFAVTDEGVFIRNGVIYKAEVSVPYTEIENVNIERTLLDRMLGISRVSLETAGSALGNITNGEFTNKSRAEAILPGLRQDKARHIHDLIIDATDGVIDSTPPLETK